LSVAGVELTADGNVVVDAGMMTGRAGIFAGGDTVRGDRTVTSAVGHGKKAARHIDAWLRGHIKENCRLALFRTRDSVLKLR
jgi:formate dehydrogenase (NADP+) beta subunit